MSPHNGPQTQSKAPVYRGFFNAGRMPLYRQVVGSIPTGLTKKINGYRAFCDLCRHPVYHLAIFCKVREIVAGCYRRQPSNITENVKNSSAVANATVSIVIRNFCTDTSLMPASAAKDYDAGRRMTAAGGSISARHPS
jgi:hypothetical protein